MSLYEPHRIARAVTSAVVIVGFVLVGVHIRGQDQAPGSRDADLAMKIVDPFVLTTTGDIILIRPVSVLSDPGLQGAIKLIRGADVAYGNFETSISDIPNFTGPRRGFMGVKEVAADVKAMGYDMVNRANNHTLDSEAEGMFATNGLLDEAGILHAGSGADLHQARSPVYMETPKGRIGLVGMHTPTENGPGRAAATYRMGTMGGKPGLNPLALSVAYIVTQEQIDALRKVRDALYTPPPGMSNPVQRGGTNAAELPLPANEPTDRLVLFGATYRVGPKPGTKVYTMNADDLRDILRSIRGAKQSADFAIAAIHAHQGPWVAQKWEFEDEPPDFLIELAHKAIDNGADVFAASGPHVLRGIEIYKGKPIFYDQGEFFRQMDLPAVDLSMYRQHGINPWTTEMTETELNKREIERRDVRHPLHYESYLAVSRYEGGQLVEVRLHPTTLGWDQPISRAGVPRLATGAVATKILERIQALSKKLGTVVTIEGNVGLIRVDSGRTSSPPQRH